MEIIICSDPHLSINNIAKVCNEFAQIRTFAKENNIKHIKIVGDIFESRTAQPQDVLHTFHEELNKFAEDDLIVGIIPGNHDKADYESEDSFLDQYKHHPNINIYSSYFCWISEEVFLHYIPYFDEATTYGEYLLKAVDKVKKNPNIRHYLFTHVDVMGSRNNDHETSEEGIDINSFKSFTKVFVGHYHDRQNIKNVYYIGSTSPRNYSEDNEKGFIIFDTETGDHVEIPLEFAKYYNVVIDLDITNVNEREELLKRYSEEVKASNFVRFVFTSKNYDILKALDKNKYREAGIEVKTIIPSIVEGIQLVQEGEYKSFTKDELKHLFKEFVKDKKITKIKLEYGNRKFEEILK